MSTAEILAELVNLSRDDRRRILDRILEMEKEAQSAATLTLLVSQDEWQRLVLSTAGKWQGRFERLEQGDYEQRDPLP